MKLIALVALFGVITTQVGFVVSEGPCNDYVDGILRDLKEDKEYFQDPYSIPVKSIEIHKKIIFINYTGEASIYDGFVFGLSSLHRDGNVIVDRKKNTHLKMYFGAGELKLIGNGKIKLMDHGPVVKLDAKIVYVNMKLDMVPSTDGTNPKVSNFKIEEVKGMEVKVSGLGPLTFFMNAYMKVIGGVFKNVVKIAIESRLKAFLDKKLKNYVIPEECLNDGLRRSFRF